VNAQNEYAEKDRTGVGVGVYAQRIVSSRQEDGLSGATIASRARLANWRR